MRKTIRLKAHKDKQVLEHDDEEEVCNNKTRLPEDLVERILAMVSFPFLFKARTLSKSWLAKFSPIESQDDEEKKMRAVSFQKQVCQHSTSWKTFCPVIVRNEDPFAYDRPSQTWQRLPSLSCLPSSDLKTYQRAKKSVQIEGALLFIPAIPNLFVVNILNQSWKQLPPHPHYVPWQESESQAQMVMSNGADGGEISYEVIILSCGRGGPHPLQIYNSKSGAWKKLDLPEGFYFRDLWKLGFDNPMSPAVHLDGVLYLVRHRLIAPLDEFHRKCVRILAINLEEEILEEFSIPSEDPLDILGSYPGWCRAFMFSNANLVKLNLMPHYSPIQAGFHFFTVKKVDLPSRRLLTVCMDPSPALEAGVITEPRPVSDGECIFFGKDSGSKVHTYNMLDIEWSSFPLLETATPAADVVPSNDQWIGSSFCLGMNPFMTEILRSISHG
ncbi:unnamed protein product [Calypogeia fissa]